MNETIQLINHASISIKLSKDTYLLSDPWYEGSAFDNGWELLYENNDDSILQILEKTNYIFISHEHPDHFSIKFLNDFEKILKEKNIKFIFQKTKDKKTTRGDKLRPLPINRGSSIFPTKIFIVK